MFGISARSSAICADHSRSIFGGFRFAPARSPVPTSTFRAGPCASLCSSLAQAIASPSANRRKTNIGSSFQLTIALLSDLGRGLTVAPRVRRWSSRRGFKETTQEEDSEMAGVHLLDRVIGSEYPSFATDDDVRAFEQVPYGDRIAAESTYDALKLAASRYPDAPAIQFLANADPA